MIVFFCLYINLNTYEYKGGTIFGAKRMMYPTIYSHKIIKMNLQKLPRIILIVMCITLTVPAFSSPAIPSTELGTFPPNNTREGYLLNRLQEIKEMTKHDLSRTEKKNLRKEVKEIKKELKATSNGVYLSVGAIIIIILLLILLL